MAAKVSSQSSMPWRSMDTAPMDGTNILVCVGHPDNPGSWWVEICHYEKRPLLGETWTASNDGFSCDLDVARYWLPIPDMPV